MSTDHLPEPLSGADCNVGELPFMPFRVQRLLLSEMALLSSGEEFKAALMLLAVSWTQTPAGSLRNDDRWLAGMARVDADTWARVKERALDGWVLCSDGRLYDRDTAEQAQRVLPDHQAFQDRRSGDAERKRREREDRARLFAAAKGLGLTVAYNTKTTVLRALVAEAEGRVTRDSRDASRVTSHGEDRDVSRDQTRDDTVTELGHVTARKGKGIEDSPQPPKGGGRDQFDKAWEIIPERCRGPADQTKAYRAWHGIVSSGEIDADGLLATVTAMAEADARSNRTQGIKAFHRWLELGRWRNWLVEPGAQPSAWSGPAWLRAAIVAYVSEVRNNPKAGEEWTRSHIDALTTWSDVPPAIVCLSSTISKRVKDMIGPMLVAHDVTLLWSKGAAA